MYCTRFLIQPLSTTSLPPVGMATLDGFIYVVGGYDGQGRIDSMERYCPETNVWIEQKPMETALSRCQAVGYNGYLYVAGMCTVVPP